MKSKRITIGVALFLVIAGIVAHVYYSNIDGYLSNIGSLMSILGSIIAISQLWQLKSKTEEVNIAIQDTKKEILKTNTFKDMTILNQMIDEVEAYARGMKKEATLLKTKQVRDELRKLSHYVKGDNEAIDLCELDKTIQRLGLYINQLSVDSNNEEVDWANLITILEDIKGILINNISNIETSR